MSASSEVSKWIAKLAWEVFEEEYGCSLYLSVLTDEESEALDEIVEDTVSEMIGHAEDAICNEFREVINRRKHELSPYLASSHQNH